MKIKHKFFTVVMVAAWMGMVQPPNARAVVSDEDFKKLTDLVGQLSEKVQSLVQTHEQDQQTIKQLQDQQGKTSELATDAQQKAEAATQQLQQPVDPVVSAASAALHNVVLAGDAEIQFGRTAGQHGGFALADFAPILLYRANQNILFEAGFDVRLQNGGLALQSGATGNQGAQTNIDLSFAQLDYLMNDYVTLVAGDMLLPLGTYSERAAGFLNKIPDDPLARSILPGSGVGAQLRGSVAVGNKGEMLTYSVYGVNGPGSVDGTGNSMYTDSNGNNGQNLDLGSNVGVNADGTQANLHNNPSGGGRVGVFVPFQAHYDMELGLSGQTGEWDQSGHKMWTGAVLDAAVHISPFFEMKGEYINTWVQTEDIGTYKPSGWWVQAAYKMAGLDLDMPYISNVELVSRYDTLNDGLGTKTGRATAGVVYYFTNTLLAEGDYEWLSSRGPNAMPDSAFILQLSYGF